jgi:hypothetical protein
MRTVLPASLHKVLIAAKPSLGTCSGAASDLPDTNRDMNKRSLARGRERTYVNRDPGRDVNNPDSALCLVYVLTPGSLGPHRSDDQVLRVDFDTADA